MSEWGRLQDTLQDEFDRQGIKGVDVNALIECIVNVRDFFPGLLEAAPDVERLARARALFHHGPNGQWDNAQHPDDCDEWAEDFAEGIWPEYARLMRERQPAPSAPTGEEES